MCDVFCGVDVNCTSHSNIYLIVLNIKYIQSFQSIKHGTVVNCPEIQGKGKD